MGRITARKRIVRITVGEPRTHREDLLAVEEPLEIRVGGSALSITMRTPGNDFDLVAGFLVAEGVISRTEHLGAIRYCAGAVENGENTFNVVDVTLSHGVPSPGPGVERNFLMTSACGLCGKASIEDVQSLSVYPVAQDPVTVLDTVLVDLPDRLRRGQGVFEKTGGLHAAALFDAETGRLLVLREDVGRHNAVDKVVGWALKEGLLPLRGTVLLVSGRASFELVQKASMAGIPVLASVSAPSSLAIELAQEVGLTVVGFLRGTSMVVYSGAERVVSHQGALV